MRRAAPLPLLVMEEQIVRLTRELDEAREQQTATSEVLRALSQSEFQLQSVLQSVAESAAKLCRSDGAVIFQLRDGVYRFAAGYSLLPEFLEIERQALISPGPGTLIGRAAMTRKVARIDDALTDPLYEKKEDAKVEGNRSMIGVPLMREGKPVVVIGMGRRRVDPFGEREIELAKSFAAQAVIAIENARLLNELRQRTAPNLTNRWSSRRPRPTCFRLSAALLAILSRCLRPCWRMPCASATPNSAPSTAGKARLCSCCRTQRAACLAEARRQYADLVPARKILSDECENQDRYSRR